jgi:hypothetical protein
VHSERSRGDPAIHQPTHTGSVRWLAAIRATYTGRVTSGRGSGVRDEIIRAVQQLL